MSCSRPSKAARWRRRGGVGTAAAVSPIGTLSWDGRDYPINGNKIGTLSRRLYDELTGIQWGTKPDPFGWTWPID